MPSATAQAPRRAARRLPAPAGPPSPSTDAQREFARSGGRRDGRECEPVCTRARQQHRATPTRPHDTGHSPVNIDPPKTSGRDPERRTAPRSARAERRFYGDCPRAPICAAASAQERASGSRWLSDRRTIPAHEAARADAVTRHRPPAQPGRLVRHSTRERTTSRAICFCSLCSSRRRATRLIAAAPLVPGGASATPHELTPRSGSGAALRRASVATSSTPRSGSAGCPQPKGNPRSGRGRGLPLRRGSGGNPI